MKNKKITILVSLIIIFVLGIFFRNSWKFYNFPVDREKEGVLVESKFHEDYFSFSNLDDWVYGEEMEYIGSAKFLTLINHSEDIEISIYYKLKGLNGQVGPTGLSGRYEKDEVVIVGGINLLRYLNYDFAKIYDEKERIYSVFYAVENEDIKESIQVDNLEFYFRLSTISGSPLSIDMIESAESVLTTLKTKKQ